MRSSRPNPRACAYSILVFTTLGAILAGASPARAGFTQFFQDHTVNYTQNSNSQPTTETGAYYLTRPTSTTSPDFTAVSLTPPVGSPFSLTEGTPGSGFWDSGLSSHTFATKALLDAAFPTGTYTLTGTGGSAPTTSTISYSQSAYSLSVPFLTGTTYSTLQGFNPSNPLTITWNSFLTGSVANSSTIFFSISGPSGSVYNQALSSLTTSVSLSANVFSPNTTYLYQLEFSNDIDGTDAGGVFLDNRFVFVTSGTFTTGSSVAVPEPSTIVLSLTACLIGLGVSRSRIRRR